MLASTYWPTYKRIEEEVTELSYSIYFDDNQIGMYSNEILDLILRISTNIESLYKDIYREEFKKTDDKIGPMIREIEKRFSLKKKIIYVSNDSFHFNKQLKDVKPFGYKSHDDNDFYSAYGSLKHDRNKNLAKANLNILIRSLAAFYALCVIYDDRSIPLQNSIYGTKTPYNFSYNSDIFSARVYDEQLAFAKKSIEFLAMQATASSAIITHSVDEMLRQCEKNLHIEFRTQCPEECLFRSELTLNYLDRLNEFKNRYSNDAQAANLESYLIFGDRSGEETVNAQSAGSLEVLIDQIKMNLEESIINIVVNREKDG